MKSGVSFWVALKDFKEIHPCWAHLNGVPLVESDLPRPISTEYKSIFDLPASRTPQEQSEAVARADQVPRTTLVAPVSIPAGPCGTVVTDVDKTVAALGEALAADRLRVSTPDPRAPGPFRYSVAV
jgi:hypothetical protein